MVDILRQEAHSHEAGVHIIHLSDHDPSGIDMVEFYCDPLTSDEGDGDDNPWIKEE